MAGKTIPRTRRDSRLAARLIRGLASLRLAIFLLVILAAVLAGATLLESEWGREMAQWHVYASFWFLGLLALLATNILAAALIRFPWKRHQVGFVVTHAGLLVLLAGAVQTFLWGIEGQVILEEGKRSDQMVLPGRSQIGVVRPATGGRLFSELTFAPGPSDWHSARELDFGIQNGLGLKVKRFLRHARPWKTWVADDQDYQGPALRLELCGPNGVAVQQEWLPANLFGGEAILGPTQYTLLPLFEPSLIEDFLHPPEKLEDGGVLSIHYAGRMERMPVADSMGRRLPVGVDGIEVEIVEYLPDAKPTPTGGFISVSENPRNPLLELRVHIPGREQPLRQVAFAQRPLLNLDGVNGTLCPVRFWFHHAATKRAAGAVFAQSSDGRLFCRPVINGQCGPAEQVQEGQQIEIGAQFSVRVADYLPRAREEVHFEPVSASRDGKVVPEAAALVELSWQGKQHEMWLQRGSGEHSAQTFFTPEGPVVVSFGYAQAPLGFTLELTDFQRAQNPGGAGDASFASVLRVITKDDAAGREQRVAMNQPLVEGHFRLYQSSFQESHGGREVSVLTAAYDPGRLLKYMGSLMVCGGIAMMFFMRAYVFRHFSWWGRRAEEVPPQCDASTPSETAHQPPSLELPRTKAA